MPPAPGPISARGSAQKLTALLGPSLLPRPPGRQTERAKARVRPEPMPSRVLPEEHGS